MDAKMERECSALGGLFQSIIGELRSAFPIWEDFAIKSSKLSCHLRSTIQALSVFLDALQRVADVAAGARGATRDIGTGLTRLCLRHRSIENHLKTLNASVSDIMVPKLQSKLEEWRRVTGQLDKEHAKEYKKNRNDIKKRAAELRRLEKKYRKAGGGGGGSSSNMSCVNNLKRVIDSATVDINERHRNMLEAERIAVRSALTEQRAEFCFFFSWFKPLMDGEVALMNEVGTLREVMDRLERDAAEPYNLPVASEAVITDVKGLESAFPHYATPPSSPGSSLGSRKSSFCSLSSNESEQQSLIGSQFSGGSGAPNSLSAALKLDNQYPPAHSVNQSGLALDRSISGGGPHATAPISPKFSSQSSGDSGFTSQGATYGSVPGTGSASSYLRGSVVEYCAATTQRIDIAARDIVRAGETGSGSEQSTPSPSPSSATWPEAPAEWPVKLRQSGAADDKQLASSLPISGSTPPIRSSTISAGEYESRTIKRTPLSKLTFVVPTTTGDQLSACSAVVLRPKTLACSNNNSRDKRLSAQLFSSLENQLEQKGPPTPPPKPLLLRPRSSASSQGQSSSGVNMVKSLEGRWNSSMAQTAHSVAPPAIPDFSQPQPDQVIPQPSYGEPKPGTSSACQEQQRELSLSLPGTCRRPSSFVADELIIESLNAEMNAMFSQHNPNDIRVSSCDRSDDIPPSSLPSLDACMEEITRMSTAHTISGPSGQRQIELSHANAQEECYATVHPVPNKPALSSSSCHTTVSVPATPADYQTLESLETSTIILRQGGHQGVPGASSPQKDSRRYSLVSNASSTSLKPPPPIRRNSSITHASSKAPAVDQVRGGLSSRATTPIAELQDGLDGSGSDYDTPVASASSASSAVRDSIHSQLKAAIGGGPVPDGYDHTVLSALMSPPPGQDGVQVGHSSGRRRLSPIRTRDSSLPSRPLAAGIAAHASAASPASANGSLSKDDFLAQIRGSDALKRLKKKKNAF